MTTPPTETPAAPAALCLNADARRLPAGGPPCDPETWLLQQHDRWILFDSNSLFAARLSPDEAGRWQRGESRLAEQSRGLLGVRTAPQAAPNADTRLRQLVLVLTEACNLRCRYCFAHRSGEVLSPVLAGRALDLFGRRDVHVSFFGGEPLLAWDTLAAVAVEARRRTQAAGTRCRLHVTTNGTLLDAGKAHFLAAHGFSVLVSLDGPPEVHNAARPHLDGRDSHSWTLHGLHHLAAAGVGATLRATFDDPDADLVERFDHLAGLVDEGLADGVVIEPAFLTEGCATGPELTDDGQEAFACRWHALVARWVDRVREGRHVRVGLVDKLLARVLHTRHALAECGAGRGYLTVTPDGALHACHKVGCAVGHLDTGVDERLRAPWCDNRLYLHEDCPTCWARHVCGGGCRHHRLEATGDLHAKVRTLCRLRNVQVREALWALAELGPAACREVVQ